MSKTCVPWPDLHDLILEHAGIMLDLLVCGGYSKISYDHGAHGAKQAFAQVNSKAWPSSAICVLEKLLTVMHTDAPLRLVTGHYSV